MKKITLLVIIIWVAIGMSVAAIALPAISSDSGKTPAIPQDKVKTTSSESTVDVSNETAPDPKKNNNSGQLKKEDSIKSNNKEKYKTKDNSKKNS